MHALAVSTEDVARIDPGQLAAWRKRPQQRMKREPLAADAQRRNRSEHVRADEHPGLGPPQRDLLPAPAVAHRQDLEGRLLEWLARDYVVPHAEALGEGAAIAVVPVEKLDDSGRLARRANALLDTVAVHGIDQPDTAVHDERMRAAQEELVDDPAEPEVELIAEPDSHASLRAAIV